MEEFCREDEKFTKMRLPCCKKYLFVQFAVLRVIDCEPYLVPVATTRRSDLDGVRNAMLRTCKADCSL